MSIHQILSSLAAAAVLPLTSAMLSAGVILEQNFDDTSCFAPGPLRNGTAATAPGGSWRVAGDAPTDFTIVTEPVASAPHALKVLRQTVAGATALRFRPADGYDFAFECKCRMKTGDGVVLHFLQDGAGAPYAGVYLPGADSPSAYNTTGGWQPEKAIPALPVDQWFTVRVAFDCANRCYRLAIVFPDGTTARGETEYPIMQTGVCDEVRFINILPAGCHSFIDDVVATQADGPALAGRQLLNAKASSPDAALSAVLSGQAGATCAVASGEPAVIEFAPEAEVNALVLRSADGAALPAVTVKALNLLGHWVELGASLQPDGAGFLLVPPAQKVTKLTLEFAGAAVLSGCAVYSPLSAGQAALDIAWGEKLDAEYRLPVYDQQYPGHDKARLTFVNHTDAPLKAVVQLTERGSGVDYGSRRLEIPVGTSDIFYDLTTMPNGEYVTSIMEDSDPGAPKRGTLERLLRHRTSPPCAAVPMTDVSGQKVFFPDGFYLAEHSGVDFVPGTAERHLVLRGKPGEDDPFIYMATQLFLDKDGRVRVNFHTMNRLWQFASAKYYNAVATDDTLDHWEISEGSAPVPPQINPLEGEPPAAARPDWNRKPGPDGKIDYHFYDAEKDGPINLSQINCEWISTSAPGTAGYQAYDWKVLTPAACTIWPVWYKAPGEAVILTRTPLVDTFPPSGSLEPPNSGSDLGFGQWLSDDGKTLYLGRGRHLIRYMPYIARYDNLYDRARIVTVWRTTDGLNWEQNYVGVPSENLPIADQHYGGSNLRLANGAGLRISLLERYSALYQQICSEYIYSWDGFRWTRFLDKPTFTTNGPLGDWYHGSGYIIGSAVEKDGRYCQLMNWCSDHYHFQSEITHGSNLTAAGYTAEYMRKRYEPRHLEDWPYFQSTFGGDWEALAKHTREATTGFGIAAYRKDGFFAATAGDEEARMLTVPLKAAGALKLNAVVNADGYIRVRLLQDGKPVAGYDKQLDACDSVELPLFDQLPSGLFQVEIRLRNASIYTLQF